MFKKKPAAGVAKAQPIAKAIQPGKAKKPTKAAGDKKQPGGEPVGKSGGEPADGILDIVHGFEPPVQGILHRFSLHLQASIARRAISWLAIYGLVSTLAAIGIAVYAANSTSIIAVDAGGRLYSVMSQKDGEIRYTDSQVSTFAVDTLFDVFDINFANFDRRLQAAANKHFTENGKQQFMMAMQPLLSELTRTQGFLIVQNADGKFGDVVAKNPDGTQWTVQVPIVMTLKPANGPAVTNQRLVTVIVNRVNDYSNLKGLAVNQVVVQGAM